MSGDVIDDTYPLNRDFLDRRKELLSTKPPSPAKSKPEKPEPPPKPPKSLHLMKPDPGLPDELEVRDPVEDEDDEEEVTGESMTLLSKKKMKADTAYKLRQEELARLRIQKQRGILIPTALVKVVFKQHSQSILVEFKNSVDSILTILRKRKNLDANEVAEIRGELQQAINDSVGKSISRSQKSISNIVNEYAEKKEVGERS